MAALISLKRSDFWKLHGPGPSLLTLSRTRVEGDSRNEPTRRCRLRYVRPVLTGYAVCFLGGRRCLPERVWAISIARLRTLPPVHLRPIDVIVFDGPCVEILS